MWAKFLLWWSRVVKKLTPFAKKIIQDVAVPLLIQFGKEAVNLLWMLIQQAASDSSLSGDQKRDWVTSQFKLRWKGELLDDASINAARELVYLQFKKEE